MLNYQLLEALDAVVAAQSFHGAAKRLHLTQSAVSQRIRLLEDQLGEPLVVRTTPLTLTARGLALLSHFQQVQLLETELLAETDTGRTMFSRVRIGTNADSLETWLLDAIAPACAEHRLLVELIAENEDLTYQLLERGEVVGCISARRNPVTGGECEFLGKMSYVGVASPAFAEEYFKKGLTEKSVASAPAVLFDRHDQMHARFLEKALGLRDFAFPHHLISSSRGFFDAIGKGIAYGVAPEHQAAPLLRSKKLKRLIPRCTLFVPLYWHYPRREGRIQRSLRKALVMAAKRELKSEG